MPTNDHTRSYVAVTATMMTETDAHQLRFVDIHTALSDPSLSLLKLQWQAGINSVLCNQHVLVLENKRKEIAKTLENLSLALSEAKANPSKEVSEENLPRHTADCEALEVNVRELKQDLVALDKNILFLREMNEDAQSKFREKMLRYLNALHTIQDKRAALLQDYIKSQNIAIQDADFEKELRLLMRNPAIEASFLASVNGGSEKGMLTTLKGWFK